MEKNLNAILVQKPDGTFYGGIMELRKYESKDCTILAELFFDTVHSVNSKDYSKEQLDVWANGNVDITAWNESFLLHDTIVAEINGIVVGFGDMDKKGYLDRLYVHKNYQNRGIADAIVNKLEEQSFVRGIVSFSTNASITAKVFFEKHGYRTVRRNTIVRNDMELINYTMKKTLSNEQTAKRLQQMFALHGVGSCRNYLREE